MTSGIPSARTLVTDVWLPELRRIHAPDRTDVDAWATSILGGYDPADPAASYGAVMGRLFRSDRERQAEWERLCERARPGYGYAVLAALMARSDGRFSTALTTNFDDLIAQALYLYRGQWPLVVQHPALAPFIQTLRSGPSVVKLHGDYHLAPLNLPNETAQLEESVTSRVCSLLSERGLIFLGYGGRDNGVVRMLEGLGVNEPRYGIYWVGHPPPEPMFSWLVEKGATIVTGNFDELMLLLDVAFELEEPDLGPLTRLFDQYQDSRNDLSKRIRSRSDTAATAELKAAASTVEDRAEERYDRAIRAYPKDANILESYAVFLMNVRKDYDRAEEMYKRAIDADPQHVPSLWMYASLLKSVRKDYDRAEEMYKRAIAVDPRHVPTLAGYASLLKSVRKDYNVAKKMYRRAMEADLRNVYVLDNHANYGGLLLGLGRRSEGVSFVKSALSRMGPLESQEGPLAPECWFYLFANGPGDERTHAQANLLRLLVRGVRSPGSDLTLNVERARIEGHHDLGQVQRLAAVISTGADLGVGVANASLPRLG